VLASTSTRLAQKVIVRSHWISRLSSVYECFRLSFLSRRHTSSTAGRACPVYQKPFTLVQKVVLEGTKQAQAELRGKENVTLTSTLHYQVCDDKQCFNPASEPLSWTLTLRSLVRERPNLKK